MVLALIGAAGSGKTTLLRHTARQVCQSRSRRRNVPVLLYLRDHASAIVAGPQTGLGAVIRGTLEGYAAEEPPGWFEHQLRRGKCLVLLDGLDEVAIHDDRSRVVDWVDRQIKQYPDNDFIITSRPHGYQSTPLDGASVLQMRRFTDEQVGRFLHRWYQAVERHSSINATDESVRDRAEAAADDLLQRLGNAPALYDLTVNPLLLTMIANVHRYRGALPASRADLYGEICEVLLWRRQEAKRLTAELRGDQKELVLQNLAFAMMQRRVRDLTRPTLLKILEAELPRLSTIMTAGDFLQEASSSGLLIERENAVYAFAHQTFQEYLSATHIREAGKTSILTEAVGDSWWREVTLLYVARADGSPIVEACLARGSVSTLALAFDCADQARELAPQLRVELDALLADAWSADIDPERRRLMAGVTVTRHLRDRIRLASRSTICLRPITAEIYRLFVNDMEARGEHRALDGPDPTDQHGADAPAVGMRASDARALVAWLNDLSGGESVYRLPTEAEINELAVQRTPGILEGSVWVASTGELDASGLWMPSGTDHPCAIDGHAICDSLTADMQDTPLLVALLLIRSRILLRIRARALHRHRNRALLPSSDLALDFDQPLALALSRAAAHEIPRSLALDSDLDLDLDRNRSPAFRDLDRDLALVHALEDKRGPAIARNVALVVDLDLALMLGLALEFALDRNLDPKLAAALIECLDRALQIARSRQHYLNFDPPHVGEFNQAFTSGQDLHQDTNVKYLLSAVRGRVRDLARARDLITGSNPITAHDLVYVHRLDWARARSLARTTAVDREFENRLSEGFATTLDEALAKVVGTALSSAITAALSSAPGPENTAPSSAIIAAEFSSQLIEASGMTTGSAVVSFDGLGDQSQNALQKLRYPLEGRLHHTARSWEVKVATLLDRSFVPILSRERRLDPEKAAAVRLAALCLAAQLGQEQSLQTTLQQIVAGITLLECRLNGRIRPTETIVVAFD